MGSDGMEIGIYIAIGTLALSIIGSAIRLTWKLRDIEREIRDDLDANVENIQLDVHRLERDAVSRADALTHGTGEMGSAIRQKIHEIEVYARDTFVRKDDFEQAFKRLESSFERGVDKLEDKIDKAIDRLRDGK